MSPERETRRFRGRKDTGPASDASDDGTTPKDRIAGELHRARLERGIEIGQAARVLHIRTPYLEALEEGRFDDLPGPTYAAGFLRAYGGFLGLDGAALAQRLKDEAGPGRQRLSFPVAAAETRRPTGIVIAGALVLAVGAAAVWYVLGERRGFDLEPVPEVPESLSAAGGGLVVTDGGEDPGIEAAVETQMQQEAVADEEPVQPPTVADLALPPAADATGGVAGGTAEDAGATDAGTVPEGAPAAPEAAAATPAAAGQAAVPVGEEAAEEGAAPAFAGAPSRIEIRALEESWIQVRRADGAVLFERLLSPGESYAAPAGVDAVLDVGNAGGLAIFVDGTALEPLGASGVAIRNLPLDPEMLVAR